MACRHNREPCLVDFSIYIYLNSVYDIVRTSVYNDAFYVRQCLQFLCGNVVGVNLAVYTQCTDGSGYHCVLVASQVQNNNHVLFHIRSNFYKKMCKNIIILKNDKQWGKKVNNILTTFCCFSILLHPDYAKH